MVIVLPVYEYKCPECGELFDRIQPMNAEKVSDCPKCGAAAKHVFSSRVAVVYKGWGFHHTDNLLPGDKQRKDFNQLKEKAEQLYYED